MSFDVINPRATATIAFEGLAVLCFNESFNDGRGRWEVAIPRFDDHRLAITFGEDNPIPIKSDVKLIEIKNKNGVRPASPKHLGAKFNRLKGNKNDKNDYRWVRNFTNGSELPHRNVRPITSPDRVKVTMMYIDDAVFYTKILDRVTIVRAGQANTAPVKGNALARRFASKAPSVLGQAKSVGSETRVLGIDVETSDGGAVEIFSDNVLLKSIDKGASPQEVFIRNLEKPSETIDDRLLLTTKFDFVLGDFFRYYQLFDVDGTRSHFWGKVASGGGTALDCCCNEVHVNLANLNAFAPSNNPA